MQTRLDLPPHKLLMDVSTRWNSSFDMCERYLEQQAAIYAALLELKKSLKDIVTLSEDDVQNVEKLIAIIKPLKTVTTMMCSQKHPTVSLIHPLKEMLLKHLQIQADSDNTFEANVKRAISSDLIPRYTNPDTLNFLLQTSAMDPRFKSLPYLEDTARCEVFESLQSAVENAIIQTVKKEPQDPTPTPGTSTSAEPALPDPGEPVEPPIKIKKESDNDSTCNSALASLFGDVFVTKVEPAKSSIDLIRAELSAYKAEECLSLYSDVSDPLLWWKGKQEKYPVLSEYVKRVLCIPATSVASERVFSTAGDVVTAVRACLSGDQVDMLVFLKQNIIIPDDLL